MKRLAVAALLLLACRTRPLDAADLAGADLALVDLAHVDSAIDLAHADGAVSCGSSFCDPATELCVFLNRGDCAKYQCVPVPAACRADRTCGCLGDAFCAGFAMGGETLKCTPNAGFPPGPDVVVCTSSIQCV